jgi:hypothetical protein
LLGGCLSNPLTELTMGVVVAMRKIEAGDVHTGIDQSADGVEAGYCRPQCCNYLGLSHVSTITNSLPLSTRLRR